MIKKSVGLLSAVSLLALPPFALSATASNVESAAALVKSGDVTYLASRILSELPSSVLELAPKSFVTYNALRIKNNHSNHGIGGGVGGGRNHRC